MATTKTKAARKRARKAEKHYTYSTFESEFFEGEFKLPATSQLPINIGIRVRNGDVNALFDWLAETGVSSEDIDAIMSLDGEEFKKFNNEWDNGVLGK